MRQVIKACRCCLQYEGGTPKAPLCPIVATTPLDLLHVDFTTIETTMELDKSPRVANVLVFQDHFTKYVLAYVTPNQTAKNFAKFLYGCYISIFRALARLLSDRGTNFTSSIIQELCEILGIQWLWTMPYHPQTKIVHTYNVTPSAVTGYSPHYLMFGRWPRLPVDFVFPTVGPSLTRLPPWEVKRWCHKSKMARWSPNDLPEKLPRGGNMGSCSLDCGHLPECPPRMGEDHR